MLACARSLATRRALLLAALALAAAAGRLLLRGAPPRPAPASPAPPAPPARLLPFEYWAHRRAHPAAYAQASCSALPAGPGALHHAAAGWQHLALPPAGSLYLYAAHWDPRPPRPPRVVVLVYCDVAPLPNLTCLLWYENQSGPCEVPATATYGWRTEWDGPEDTVNEPYVLACVVREGCGPGAGAGAPRAVSLATGACPPAPATLLAVQGAPPSAPAPAAGPPPPTSVAACIKWLDYRDDHSADLVEWLELVRALGADKIYIYVLQAHRHMRRVVRHYAQAGLLDVTELEHPPRRRELAAPEARAFTAMRRELLPLNDCLYRLVGARTHAWLAVIDLDELIVPLKDATWGALIARQLAALRGASVDALVFLNYYYLRGAQRETAAPPPAHMLAHVWRAAAPSLPGYYVKSFFNVSSVVAMHNHSPLSCGARDCRDRDVPPEDGRLQHYRERCASGEADCPALHDAVRDAVLLARCRRVLAAARDTLRRLDLPLAAPPPPPE